MCKFWPYDIQSLGCLAHVNVFKMFLWDKDIFENAFHFKLCVNGT